MPKKKVVKQNKIVVTRLFVAALLMLLAFIFFDLVDKRLRVIKATTNNMSPKQQIEQELKAVDGAVKGSTIQKIDDSGLNEKALGL